MAIMAFSSWWRLHLPVLAIVLLLPHSTLAWKPGVNSDAWTNGATVNVFVDPIPADAPPGTSEAVNDAIFEWNEAQAPFGGLHLVRTGTTKANADIHIRWFKNNVNNEWGVTSKKSSVDRTKRGFGRDTVQVGITYGAGLTASGITRLIKHELGHAEGLGHSAASALMRWNAYSTQPNKPPTAADLNAAGPFIEPTADDLAGKDDLWGTKDDRDKYNEDFPDLSTVSFNSGQCSGQWRYRYGIQALTGPGFVDPITELTLEISPGVRLADLSVTLLPAGWGTQFFEVQVDPLGPGEMLLDPDPPGPSLFSFFASLDFHGSLTP